MTIPHIKSQQPHYVNSRRNPEADVCKLFTYDNDLSHANQTKWEAEPPSPDAEVIRVNTIRVEGKAQPPHWEDPAYGQDSKAERIAQAVKKAVDAGLVDVADLI